MALERRIFVRMALTLTFQTSRSVQHDTFYMTTSWLQTTNNTV